MDNGNYSIFSIDLMNLRYKAIEDSVVPWCILSFYSNTWFALFARIRL